MVTWMDEESEKLLKAKVQSQGVFLRVLSFSLIFCQFQPAVAYESVVYK